MLIYILDPITFDRVAVIEEYESCIWVERFIVAGDFTLVIPQIASNTKLLISGAILENEESDEPMLIEGLDLKDGALTVTGKTIETFFNQRSFHPLDNNGIDDTLTPDDYGTPGRVLAYFVDQMQDEYYDYDTAGLAFGTDIVTSHFEPEIEQASGDNVYAVVNKPEKVYDLLLRLAKQYNVDIWVKRIFHSAGNIEWGFCSRNPVDRSAFNPDGNATVRFAAEDDNLIDVHEVYNAVDDIVATVVYVPRHFSAYHQIGYQISGAGPLSPIIYGRDTDGVEDFRDSLDELGFPAFARRIQEVDSSKLTLDYLKQALERYYDVLALPAWSTLTIAEKQAILIGEMQRLAKAEYKKAKRIPKHVMDGEVASSIYRYGIEYKLGDVVEIAAELQSNISHDVETKIVAEFIRSLDSSGKRAYPTLSAPAVFTEYNDDPEHPIYVDSDTYDHTFSINGILPVDLTHLSPHKISVKPGQTKQLIRVSQTGPTSGTCTLKFEHNGNVINTAYLPIVLADGDLITVDASIHSTNATNVSGHFTIRVT